MNSYPSPQKNLPLFGIWQNLDFWNLETLSHSLLGPHPKGDQSWVFIGRTDVEAETQILWPPDVKSWLIWKDTDAGKDWGQEEMGMIEDELVGWHHRLNGHGFWWTLGVGDGQGVLACWSPWGHKESDMIEQLNWTELNWIHHIPPKPSLLAFISW